MRTRWGLAAIATAAVVTIGACADPEDQSLCTVYADFEAERAELQSIRAERAGEAAEAVENLLGRVRHLDAVADTRYSDQLDQLESSLDDLLRVLESVDEDADPSTWEPLVEDSVEDAQHDLEVVSELIAPVCQAQTGVTTG